MKVRGLMVTVLLTCLVLTAPVLANPDQAAAKFSEGQTLLVKADFDGALKAYTAAAKADKKNTDYRDELALLKRIMKMRQALDKAKGPEWITTAEALFAYYKDHKIYTEALPLGVKLHSQQNTPDSAAQLARTQLALSMNAEAAHILGAVVREKLNAEVRVLMAVAMARQNKLVEARGIAAEVNLGSSPSGQLLFDLACLKALLGQPDEAITMLIRAFEATPPAELATIKAQAKECKDLAALRDKPAFAQALNTASKVSGKANCGKCPMKEKCTHDKDAGKDKPGAKDQHPCPAGKDAAGKPDNGQPQQPGHQPKQGDKKP